MDEVYMNVEERDNLCRKHLRGGTTARKPEGRGKWKRVGEVKGKGKRKQKRNTGRERTGRDEKERQEMGRDEMGREAT
jgi:hypothetical protein